MRDEHENIATTKAVHPAKDSYRLTTEFVESGNDDGFQKLFQCATSGVILHLETYPLEVLRIIGFLMVGANESGRGKGN